MVLVRVIPMEAVAPLIGEAWDRRRRRWRQTAIAAGLGVLLLVALNAARLGGSGHGPAATARSSGHRIGVTARSSAVVEPASRVFADAPYIGGPVYGQNRPARYHHYARLSIILHHPTESVVADFTGMRVVLGYFNIPKRRWDSLRHAALLGLRRHAVFVGYFVPPAGFYARHRASRGYGYVRVHFTIEYRNGARVSTNAEVRTA
jgi:hypothetical protein